MAQQSSVLGRRFREHRVSPAAPAVVDRIRSGRLVAAVRSARHLLVFGWRRLSVWSRQRPRRRAISSRWCSDR